MAARIIAVCNQKGGVGKTTLVTGLAEVLSRDLLLKVLVVDADPQRNTTSTLGIVDPEFTLNDVLYGDEEQKHRILPGVAADAVMSAGDAWQGEHPSLDLIASERNLASRERDSMMAREGRLRTALRGVADQYDIVLIDCPPSLGLLTVNALTAATHALMVSEPRVGSVEGLTEIVTTIAEVQESLNENLDVVGIVVNKKKKNRLDQDRWIMQMRQDYDGFVLEPSLFDREIYAKSQAGYVPLKTFGSSSTIELASLKRLAENIMERTAP